jgi:hypothetical protein
VVTRKLGETLHSLASYCAGQVGHARPSNPREDPTLPADAARVVAYHKECLNRRSWLQRCYRSHAPGFDVDRTVRVGMPDRRVAGPGPSIVRRIQDIKVSWKLGIGIGLVLLVMVVVNAASFRTAAIDANSRERRGGPMAQDAARECRAYGWELADRVRRGWRGARFVLATGWGAAIDAREARSRGVQAVLAKPYRLADLMHVLAMTDEAA